MDLDAQPQTEMEITNPNPEIRKKSEGRSPKAEACAKPHVRKELTVPGLRRSVFGFLSDFGIRISDLTWWFTFSRAFEDFAKRAFFDGLDFDAPTLFSGRRGRC